jgi:hypothetical protein
MIRIIIETCEAGMAANVGGSVQTSYRTFDVELPEVEAFLRQVKGSPYTERQVLGVELLP